MALRPHKEEWSKWGFRAHKEEGTKWSYGAHEERWSEQGSIINLMLQAAKEGWNRWNTEQTFGH